MDIESGLVAVDLTSVALSAELLPQASDVPYRIARDAIRNIRKVGREAATEQSHSTNVLPRAHCVAGARGCCETLP